MSLRQFVALAAFVLLIIGLTLFNLGCKKDSGPTTPSGNTSSGYGSGTITTTSTVGSLSITGTGVWPLQAGPSVLAVVDTTGAMGAGVLLVLGYQQVSGPNYNAVAFGALMPTTGAVAGTYSYPDEFGFGAAYNADTSYTDSLEYTAVSGNLVVDSATGSNASGTYSVMARQGLGQPIQFTGTFNVTYVVGGFPELSRRSVSRSAYLHRARDSVTPQI